MIGMRTWVSCFALGLAACAAVPSTPSSAAAADPALGGTRWVGMVDKDVPRGGVPRLEFLREGKLTGFTGCNLLSGTWSVEAGTLRFGPVVTTKRACMGPEAEVEKRVLAA